jgi:hypothetical protein
MWFYMKYIVNIEGDEYLWSCEMNKCDFYII